MPAVVIWNKLNSDVHRRHAVFIDMHISIICPAVEAMQTADNMSDCRFINRDALNSTQNYTKIFIYATKPIIIILNATRAKSVENNIGTYFLRFMVYPLRDISLSKGRLYYCLDALSSRRL